MELSLILAAAFAALVFVAWVALATLAQKRWAERSAMASTQLPEPTPEELMEARSLGLIPQRPNPTVPTRGER